MNNTPPKWAMRFFRWYCRKDLADAVEGDLFELYQRRCAQKGARWARVYFVWYVLTFFRPFAFKSHHPQNPNIMWRSHFKIAFRMLMRKPAFALTNLFSLALGITASFFLMLYVVDELSYDRFHNRAYDIYRVDVISYNPEANFYRTNAPAPLAAYLASNFPEVQHTTKLTRPRTANDLMKANDKEFYETLVYMGDEGLFEVFSFELLQGDARTALSEPGQIVLTESMALKYFDRTDVVGEQMNYENLVQLQVTAVLKDLPSNSSLQFNFLISNRTQGLFYRNWQNDWGNSNAGIYMKLEEGTDPLAVEARFPPIVETYMKEDLDDEERYVMSLHRLTDLHLSPHVAPERLQAVSNSKYIVILPIVGLFILLIAGFNFVNLSTARMTERMKEVGVRKVMGSARKALVSQFLIESVLMVLSALLISALLWVLLLPSFNQLAGKALTVNQVFQPQLIASSLGLTLLLGLIAGLYPALVLSRIKPVTAFSKGAGKAGPGRGQLRNVLLTLQFAVALVMIISSVMVNRQLDFLSKKSLGFEQEQVLYFVNSNPTFWQNAEAFKNEVLKNPNVASVSFSSGVPGNAGYGSTARVDDGARVFEIRHIMLDEDFIDLYGLEVIQGRPFSENIATDKTAAYLLNETAARQIGWDDPIGASMSIWSRPGKVIGVVKDFHFQSMKEAIGPMALHFGPMRYRIASIKLNTSNLPATLDFLEEQWEAQVPDRPFQYNFIDSRFAAYYEEEKRFSSITDLATGLGMLLAVIGLFSLMAFLINQRTKEIGIRKVLGAGYVQISQLFLSRVMWLCVLALIIAVPLAWWGIDGWLQGFAYHIDISVTSFALAALVLIGLVLATVGLQVGLSGNKNPADTLRYE